MNRLGLRGRLTIVVGVGAALALAALTAGFNLILRSSLDHDANQVLTARAAATLATVEIRHGVLHGTEAPDRNAPDALVWLFSGGRVVESPVALPELAAEARALATGPRRTAEDSTSDVRLYSTPVVHRGVRVGTVVVGVSLEPYERSAARALTASLGFALALFVLILIATRLVIGGALRPVARMTGEAADWSEHDLDHRFAAGDPHDELTRLAATFDSMLDRLAASLRHERRFSAEVSHELRTPLAAIVAEADLSLRRERDPSEYREAMRAIADRGRQLERTLETLLAAERAEIDPLGVAEAAEVAERARAACAQLAAERGVHVGLRDGRALRLGVDAEIAERVLAPLVENACRYARRSVIIEVRDGGERIEYVVSDDGPGVRADEREQIFDPGTRGSAARLNGSEGGSGAGLGLSLARRLARAVDGDVVYSPGEGAFVFSAPRA
jgi:two-component system OmpR family sensor kinase